MRFLFVGIILIGINLFAYDDKDLDGVDDSIDRCPETLMSELVNTEGCPIHSLLTEHQYDIVAGFDFSQMNYTNNEHVDTLTYTLQFDYFYKNISAQVIASTYSSDNEKGMNDTLVAGYYQLFLNDQLSLKVGCGLLLPTYETGYNNEATDYFGTIGLTYMLHPEIALLSGYTYLFVKDKNVAKTLTYQNSEAYWAGINYFINNKLTLGTLYNISESIYRDADPIQMISAYCMYRFDSHWFGTANYAYGLNDSTSRHAIDFRLGYSF